MIREAIGNTVVRFYSDKKTAAQVAEVMKLSVREYQESGRFFLAEKDTSVEVFDQSGMIFNTDSLKESSQYQADLKTLMTNSKAV